MKKRDLIVVLAVLAFGVIYNFIESGEIRFVDGCSRNQLGIIDLKSPNSFPRPELSYVDAGIQEIEINNIAGAIEVVKSQDGQLRIQPEVRVYHRNHGSATDIQKNITIIPTRSAEEPGKLRVDVGAAKDFNYNRVRVFFKVSLPDTVALNLWNRYGDVIIDGTGKNIRINSQHGDIGVKHVTADLTILHAHGKLVLRDIKGALDLNSSFSRISVSDVAALKLNCGHAQVFLTNIEQETTVEDGSYSEIKFETGKNFIFDGRHTDIQLNHIKNGVKISDSHGSIDMEDINGNINIQTKHCLISLKQAQSEEVFISNEYTNVELSAISAKRMDIQLSHGDLEIDFIDISEQLNIKNSYSNVTLSYPKTLQPSFDINLSYGEFQNSTPVQLAIVSENNSTRINHVAGLPKITIVNTYDDIQLKNNTYQPGQKKDDVKTTPPTAQPNQKPVQKVETEEFKKLEEQKPVESTRPKK